MNLSFSTRGWQSLGWDEIIEIADEMKFSGIELYNVQNRPDFTEKGCPLHKYNTAATVRTLRERGINIPSLDTSCDISVSGNSDSIKELIDIAHNLKVAYVCAVALNNDEETVKSSVAELISYAEEVDVVLLIKTSGIYSDTARLRSLMDEFASDNLGALWDMHHPYRTNGESADKTIRNLGAYVKHVHLRDSDNEETYNLIGEGNLPIAEMMRALSSIDYNGFISLEWKPEWMEDLQEYEVIFPHFVNYMNRFESPRGKKRSLYYNFDHSGQFIWKKDSLIDLTFPQVLDKLCEDFPDQYAFRYTTLDYTRTYSEFREDVDRFARALAKRSTSSRNSEYVLV